MRPQAWRSCSVWVVDCAPSPPPHHKANWAVFPSEVNLLFIVTGKPPKCQAAKPPNRQTATLANCQNALYLLLGKSWKEFLEDFGKRSGKSSRKEPINRLMCNNEEPCAVRMVGVRVVLCAWYGEQPRHCCATDTPPRSGIRNPESGIGEAVSPILKPIFLLIYIYTIDPE